MKTPQLTSLEHPKGCLASLALLLVLALGPQAAEAQTRGPDDERPSRNGLVEGTVGDTHVTVRYGRPKAKGRTIWGALVPYGEVWRAGANEATTISFSTGTLLNGNPVPAGTYSIFIVPEEHRWTYVVNKVADQWGAYRYDSDQDLVRFDIESESCERVEELTISLSGNRVVLAWGARQGGFSIGNRPTEP